MSEIYEEMIQGYCKSSDRSRILTCEYSVKDGKNILEYTDCVYGTCVHSKNCRLIEEAFKRLNLEEESSIVR